MAELESCLQCGARGLDGRPPWCFCRAVVEGFGEIEALLAEAEQTWGRNSLLMRLVLECRRSDARAALEAIVRQGEGSLLFPSAVHSLATIASPESMPVVLGLIEQGGQAAEVVRYLARVESAEAADRLVELGSGESSGLSGEAAIAAAWRGDGRALPRLLEMVAPERSDPVPLPVFNERAIEALVLLADPAAVPELIRCLADALDIDAYVRRCIAAAGDLSPQAELARRQEMARLVGISVPETLEPTYDEETARSRVAASALQQANRHLSVLVKALLAFDDPAAADAVDRASRILGRQLDDDRLRPDDAVDIADEDCTVPAWVLDYELGDPDHPGTRFGGQPSWRSHPTWPLTPTGTPMAFWAQFEVPWATDQMAYLFIDTTEEALLGDLSETSSLFIQPGGGPEVPWKPYATGPQVPDGVQRDRRYRPAWPHGFAARVPSLKPFNEPTSWPEGRFQAISPLNKVGGTPLAIQSEPIPPTPSYRFLFQFRAYDAGFELSDVAECYGYIDTESGNGFFHWDCH